MPLVSYLYTTPLGEMLALCTERGLCLLEFVGQKGVARERAQVEAYCGVQAHPGASAITEQLGTELTRYFGGDLRTFDIPLDWVGTAFQKDVWKTLLLIPYGETWTYAQEATVMGRPTAVRAVAAANGQNKISIVVPCHRVIGSNGTLTGYGGGLPRKQWLLALERSGKAPAAVAEDPEAFALD